MSIHSGQKGTECGAFSLFSFNLVQNSGREELLAPLGKEESDSGK